MVSVLAGLWEMTAVTQVPASYSIKFVSFSFRFLSSADLASYSVFGFVLLAFD